MTVFSLYKLTTTTAEIETESAPKNLGYFKT